MDESIPKEELPELTLAAVREAARSLRVDLHPIPIRRRHFKDEPKTGSAIGHGSRCLGPQRLWPVWDGLKGQRMHTIDPVGSVGKESVLTRSGDHLTRDRRFIHRGTWRHLKGGMDAQGGTPVVSRGGGFRSATDHQEQAYAFKGPPDTPRSVA
jgi:hypothetical protein